MTGIFEASVIRLGLLRLTDAAPVILAHERGLFRNLGIDVALSIEPSWANIADKLSYGLLDGAVILPPLALAMAAGARMPATSLIVPMSLSQGGNALIMATSIAETMTNRQADPAPLETARQLKRWLDRGVNAPKPRIAVVHTLSSHNLLLRYWLEAGGIRPDEDIEIPVIPPAEMVDTLESGAISGFCAGAPWGDVAGRAGLGRMIVGTSGIWAQHPEKCLALRRDWSERHPEMLQALLRGLLRAAQLCDDPLEAPGIARLLARSRYLAVAAGSIRASLPGARRRKNSDPSTFFRYLATYPWQSQGLWFFRQLQRWGYVDAELDAGVLVRETYRPDLYNIAAQAEGLPAPLSSLKPEGSHLGAWELETSLGPLPMPPDSFCDGQVFNTIEYLP